MLLLLSYEPFSVGLSPTSHYSLCMLITQGKSKKCKIIPRSYFPYIPYSTVVYSVCLHRRFTNMLKHSRRSLLYTMVAYGRDYGPLVLYNWAVSVYFCV